MANINVRSLPFIDTVSGVRSAVFVLGKIFVIAAAFFAVDMGCNIGNARREPLPAVLEEEMVVPLEESLKTPLESYKVIVSRNIFGLEKAVPVSTGPAKPVSTLKLNLVGVNISRGNQFAIVEDSTRKVQDVFELQEMIFDQAKLVKILPESIQIEHNGKIETLVLPEGSTGGGAESGSASNDGSEFTVDEEELSNALANLPRLLSQARAVPYFRNGKSVGMRLFAIRRGSMYEKLGLQNGDIIKSVNDNSLSDPSQALKIFEQLKDERTINVELERKGQRKDLNYSIR